MVKPDPPTEEEGCICEVPDTRPLSEQKFDLVDAFFGGFKADDDFKNALPCSYALRHSINDFNQTTLTWKDLNNTEKYGNLTSGQKFEYYLFNTTEWISYDLASGGRYCYGTGLDVWNYTSHKMSQFDDWSDVGLSFLQNMLGNSITF